MRGSLCGTVALAETFGQPDIGPRFMRQILVARARIEGFLVLDYQHRYVEARTRLAEWNRAGKLQYQYDIADGLENTPNAFLQMLTSKNLGKQLVRVGPEA
jgi:NADPH-dependent curcumin reductase CurA